jgi:pimeloyl-ACP methyl ester carboxylesterase
MKKMNNILFISVTCFTLIIISSAVFIVSAQQHVPFTPGIEGIWQGELNVPGMVLRIVFKISKNPDGTLTGTLDSPDQGVTGIQVEKIILEDNTLYVEINSIGGTFKGKISNDFLTIEGNFKQAGQSLPLMMKKVNKTIEIYRPQEPKKPYPYIEEEVRYDNKEAGIKLAGTLTLPAGKGPFPVVLLISGSGPQDRNETVFSHRPFLILADYLTRQGIAVLRADDRGVGASTGDFSQATSEDFASDALAGIVYLKTRKEIKPEQIGLIGHSEGGIIAPMVAVKSPDLAFIVLMAGTGLTGEEILNLQQVLISRAMGVSEEDIAKTRQFNEKIYSLIKDEKDRKNIEERLHQVFMNYWAGLSEEEKNRIGDPEVYIKAQLRSLLSPWFKFFLTYDPKSTLSKVKCPVLAINGEKDLQVSPKENLSVIEEALVAGGNKNVTTKEIPGLNHLFQTAQTGSPDEYAKIEETISPVALKIISDWILEQTRDK